jgi:hypothetical protein
MEDKKTSGFAIASFVLGIASLVLGWIPLLGWAIFVLAITFGFIALSKIKNENYSGKGLAIAGIIMGFIPAILSVILFGFLFFIDSSGQNTTTNGSSQERINQQEEVNVKNYVNNITNSISTSQLKLIVSKTKAAKYWDKNEDFNFTQINSSNFEGVLKASNGSLNDMCQKEIKPQNVVIAVNPGVMIIINSDTHEIICDYVRDDIIIQNINTLSSEEKKEMEDKYVYSFNKCQEECSCGKKINGRCLCQNLQNCLFYNESLCFSKRMECIMSIIKDKDLNFEEYYTFLNKQGYYSDMCDLAFEEFSLEQFGQYEWSRYSEKCYIYIINNTCDRSLCKLAAIQKLRNYYVAGFWGSIETIDEQMPGQKEVIIAEEEDNFLNATKSRCNWGE